MDLYKYHNIPKDLNGYHEADEIVPERIWKIAESGKKLTLKQEKILAKHPEWAWSYVQYILKKPWPMGEDAISKGMFSSYMYAYHILEKKRFPKGEDVIAKDPEYAYKYAFHIIKGPWPKGEDAIAEDEFYSYMYARSCLNKRFLKAEPLIAQDKDNGTKRQYESYFGVKL